MNSSLHAQKSQVLGVKKECHIYARSCNYMYFPFPGVISAADQVATSSLLMGTG